MSRHQATQRLVIVTEATGPTLKNLPPSAQKIPRGQYFYVWVAELKASRPTQPGTNRQEGSYALGYFAQLVDPS